jgi:hypothetical protein
MPSHPKLSLLVLLSSLFVFCRVFSTVVSDMSRVSVFCGHQHAPSTIATLVKNNKQPPAPRAVFSPLPRNLPVTFPIAVTFTAAVRDYCLSRPLHLPHRSQSINSSHFALLCTLNRPQPRSQQETLPQITPWSKDCCSSGRIRLRSVSTCLSSRLALFVCRACRMSSGNR